MKTIYLSLIVLSLVFASACTKPTVVKPAAPDITYKNTDFYYYGFTTIDGKPAKISDYKGKKIMIVNTASLCGNTPQYEKLEALYNKYITKLVIIGFPCNQFAAQEPGTNQDIQNFCTGTYHVTFPMSQKIDVKGANQDPLYKWLTTKALNGHMDSEIAWNFQKYLMDEQGNFVAMFANDMQPDDPSITAAIEK